MKIIYMLKYRNEVSGDQLWTQKTFIQQRVFALMHEREPNSYLHCPHLHN